jgi:hypothetical protein
VWRFREVLGHEPHRSALAADDEAVHAVRQAHPIKPLIQNRALWQVQPQRPLPGGRSPLQLVQDEAGTVPSGDTVSDPPARHQMAYIGCYKDR